MDKILSNALLRRRGFDHDVTKQKKRDNKKRVRDRRIRQKIFNLNGCEEIHNDLLLSVNHKLANKPSIAKGTLYNLPATTHPLIYRLLLVAKRGESDEKKQQTDDKNDGNGE